MYNEAPYVGRCLPAVIEAVRAVTDDFEIIVVDDASTDDTAQRVRDFAAVEPAVRLVQNPQNLTLGGTLRAGFQAATKDLIFYTDADLPFDLGLLGKAIRLARFLEADLVAAYRFHRTEEGFIRTIYSCAYNWLCRVLLKVRIRDINFSFKLFKRSLLDEFELHSQGSFIDAELVAKTHHSGHRIIQFGVDYFPRGYGVSTLSSFKVIGRIISEFARLRRQSVRVKARAAKEAPE